MFVELLEFLRCPRPHSEEPLVASAVRTESRHIIDGTLGCPICRAEFQIVGGIARFDAPPRTTPPELTSLAAAMRLAALLDLSDPNGFALLCGRAAVHADGISRLAATKLILVNPAPHVPSDTAAGVIITNDVVPFVASSARAAAVDEAMSDALVASVARTVRSAGRLVAPSSVPLPKGVKELARDEQTWVAEKTEDAARPGRLAALVRRPR